MSLESQAIAGTVDTINSTGVRLIDINAKDFTEGTFVYVRNKTAFYILEFGKSYVIDHNLYETALGTSNGQWAQLSSGSGNGTVYCDGVSTGTIQLSSLSSASFTEGQVVYVATLKCFFDLQASTATAVPLVNIAATGKSGYQWVRRMVRNPTWEVTSAFWVDPQNGSANDENSGTSSGSPCASLTEISRRLAYAVLPTNTTLNVTLISDCMSTDKPVWSFAVQAGAGAGTGLVVTGTPTVVYTGTVTGFAQQVQGAVATATDNELTDSGIPTSYTASGLVASGLLFQRTNGTYAAWFPLKDLGAKTLRMSDADNVGATSILALAINDTYTASRLTKVYDQFFTSHGKVAYVTFALIDDNSTTPGTPLLTAKADPPLIYDRCTFTTSRQLSNMRLKNCGVWGPTSSTSPGVFRMDGGAVISLNGLVISNNSVFVNFLNTHFQGGALALNGTNHGASILSFYDTTADGLVMVAGNTTINVIKGKGNAGKLLRAADYAAIIGYNSTTAPPCVSGSTSDANPVQAGNSAIPGTSIACSALPLTAEIVTRMLGVVPF